jgi:hypothetical protein
LGYNQYCAHRVLLSILLNKTVLFAAFWLPFLFFLFRVFEPKRATIFSLLVPTAFGLIFYTVAPNDGPVRSFAQYVFGYANLRMMAIPSIAMNYYSDFFATSPSTHFCQINLVRSFVSCP